LKGGLLNKIGGVFVPVFVVVCLLVTPLQEPNLQSLGLVLAEGSPAALFQIGIFRSVRYPLHDHVRSELSWSN
jgi:hypothetical protein